jgi:UDP-glucuronate 4-epimerase
MNENKPPLDPHPLSEYVAWAGNRNREPLLGVLKEKLPKDPSNILEIARIKKVKKFIYASSSSVYGEAKIFPFTESDKNIDPISIYGASKLTNEILAKSYSRNFSLVCIGLRFFTVYGPFGRPDMAYFKFSSLNRENKVVDIYNKGKMFRDFTYITDIISAINKVIKIKIKKKNLILNIGKGKPNKLIELIKLIEKYQKKKN